jgi:TPR repeat protein
VDVQREGNALLGLPPNLAREASLLEKACGLGDAEGCFRFGVLVYDSGATSDARLAPAYRAACGREHAGACNNLGVLHEWGQGGATPNQGLALKLFEQACSLQNSKGCENATRLQTRARREARIAAFRASVKSGDESHCGLVIEVKDGGVQGQSMVGPTWLKSEQLSPSGAADCRFRNKVYVEP